MAKSLTLEQLKKDKQRMLEMLQRTQQQLSQLQIQAYRFHGIVSYLDDNIKALEERKE